MATLGCTASRKACVDEVALLEELRALMPEFLAYHSGVDFREAHGAPVLATGAGRVTSAGSNGGYGLMVEIDHGGGMTTRYAHLSALLVAEGQFIPSGAIVGRLGSTGRSTGPHLHYEVRIDDEPVDPMRFLRAGARLFAQN